MNINQLTGVIPASFEAVGINPDGTEEAGTIKIKINRLAFKTVTEEGFAEAMAQADKNPRVIGDLLAGKIDPETGEETLGLLAAWEVFKDVENSQMLEITCDSIINLPFDFVTSLSEAVMARLFPGPVKAGKLAVGSDPDVNTSLALIPSSPEAPKISNDDTPSLELVGSGE